VTETISLDPSLHALWRRKWLVLAGALVCAAIAAGVTMATPARYQTSALVEVGRVMGEQLEDPYAVAQTINSAGFRAATREQAGNVTAEALTGGQGRLERPTLVRVTASGARAEQAVAAGQAAVDELARRHKERFEAAIAGYREHERVLAGSSDPAAQRELYDLRARLASPIFTAETGVKDPFPVPSSPVPKNTLVTAGIAFVVGLAILALLVMALAQVSPLPSQR
jgi:hypothetical protein